MKNLYIPHLDITTSEELIKLAQKHGYVFYGIYKNKSVSEIIEIFYKYNHGNSKLLWNFYFNNITNKLEITTTTKSIEKSYPHIKNVPITYFWGLSDPFI